MANMDVKNPTGVTQNYAFGSLILTAGEIKTIDTSFVEDQEFQKSVEAGTIVIMRFEQDPVTHTALITINRAETSPSPGQKGAMVLANNPSSNNPFATHEDLDDNNVKLTRNTVDIVQLEGFENRVIWIGNTKLQLLSPALFDFSSDFAINASGVSTGALFPSASAFYFYVSGNGNVAGDGLLRPSITAPTFHDDGLYLNSDRNWKYVGCGRTTSLRQVPNDTYVKSEFHKDPVWVDVATGTGVQNGTVASTLQELGTFSQLKWILAPGEVARVDFDIALRTALDGDKIRLMQSSKERFFEFFPDDNVTKQIRFYDIFSNNTSECIEFGFDLQFQGTSTQHTWDRDKSYIYVTFL